jgi:RNA polymerase sigma factor (TIGR02999 family)
MDDSSDDTEKIDTLLEAARGGDSEAMRELMPLVYDELRKRARSILSNERRKLTLQTTALVHEAYINLAKSSFRNWEDRTHFFRVAARVMRNILTERARKRLSLKGGGEYEIVSTDGDDDIPDFERDEDLVRLNEALIKLEKADKTLAEVVEQRFFLGLTIEKTAEVMNISPATVKRNWARAKAWLFREMKR